MQGLLYVLIASLFYNNPGSIDLAAIGNIYHVHATGYAAEVYLYFAAICNLLNNNLTGHVKYCYAGLLHTCWQLDCEATIVRVRVNFYFVHHKAAHVLVFFFVAAVLSTGTVAQFATVCQVSGYC